LRHKNCKAAYLNGQLVLNARAALAGVGKGDDPFSVNLIHTNI
jgi:hypothetical protein